MAGIAQGTSRIHTAGSVRDPCAPAPELRICTGNFINGKEKPLHLFVECGGNPSAVFRFGRGVCRKTATRSVGR